MAIVADQFNLTSGVAVTIQFADGTYTAPFIAQPYVGNGQIIVQGNVTTPNNVLFQTTIVRNAIFAVFECRRRLDSLQGFGISSTVGSGNGNGVLVQGSCALSYNNMNFGALPGGFHLSSSFSGIITQTGNYTISGGAASHAIAQDLSVIHITQLASTITISGTPAFSTSFVQTHGAGAVIGILPSLFSGSATGTRWQATLLSLIDSGAPTSIPGNANGTIPAANTLGTDGAYVD